MKKINFILIVGLILITYSCCDTNTNLTSETWDNGEYRSFSTMLNKCKGTTKVIGIGENDGSFKSTKICIVVIDSTNTTYSCRIGGTLGLHIGDIIK